LVAPAVQFWAFLLRILDDKKDSDVVLGGHGPGRLLLKSPRIAALGEMERRKEHRGYIISWQEPPMTSAEWVVNVASNERDLQNKIGKSAKVITGQTRDDAIANAKAFIDMLLC
jgi:glyoxylase-like metal-dependent hydrolase (beta-lactamase superfamily II)